MISVLRFSQASGKTWPEKIFSTLEIRPKQEMINAEESGI